MIQLVDHQTVTLTFFWCYISLRKGFVASSQSKHCTDHCLLLYTIHFLYVTRWSGNGSCFLLFCFLQKKCSADFIIVSFILFSFNLCTDLLNFFYLPICWKCWRVNVLFFCNIFTCFVWVYLNNNSQLIVVSERKMSVTLVIFKALISITTCWRVNVLFFCNIFTCFVWVHVSNNLFQITH